MNAPVEYPYRFCGVSAHPLRYNSHCKIVEFDSPKRGWVTVEFQDGGTLRTPRLTVRLREQYKREEVAGASA